MNYEVIQGNTSNIFRFRVKNYSTGTYRSFTANDSVRMVIKKKVSSPDSVFDELMTLSNDTLSFLYEMSPTETNIPVGKYVVLFQWANSVDFDPPKVVEIQGNVLTILEQGIV